MAPAVNALDGVYLYERDDLAEAAAANAEERRRETVRAEAIVLEEQQRFDGWLAALEAVPTIRDLRSRAESIRAAELERALPRLGLDEAQRDAVEALTKGIVNKLLHAPLSRLRSQSDQAGGFASLEAVRVLFGLDATVEEGAEAPEPEVDADLPPRDGGGASSASPPGRAISPWPRPGAWPPGSSAPSASPPSSSW